MNRKPSNLKITIHSLFIKQLYFLSLPFSFSFLSSFFLSAALCFFFPLSVFGAITVSDGAIFSLSAISLRQRVELAGSNSNRSLPDKKGFEFLQFCEEIQQLMTIPLENASSFTTLLELSTTQAMELLHSQSVDEAPTTPSTELTTIANPSSPPSTATSPSLRTKP